MATESSPTLHLATYAAALRKEVPAPKQAEVFRLAVEAGCLAAFSDIEVDASEREAIIAAVGVLSTGDVVEWEADTLVDECTARIATDGIEARVAAVGEALKRLRQAEPA